MDPNFPANGNYPPQQNPYAPNFNAPPQAQQPYNAPPPAQPVYGPDQLRLQNEGWNTARNMHAGGIHPATIYDVLVKKGIDPPAAQRIVQSATSVPASSGKSEAGKDMLIGGGLIVLGLAITIGTYAAASDGGGYYLISYGPIIYGVIHFFKGVAKLGR